MTQPRRGIRRTLLIEVSADFIAYWFHYLQFLGLATVGGGFDSHLGAKALLGVEEDGTDAVHTVHEMRYLQGGSSANRSHGRTNERSLDIREETNSLNSSGWSPLNSYLGQKLGPHFHSIPHAISQSSELLFAERTTT